MFPKTDLMVRCDSHLACSVVPIRSWQVQQVRPILGQEGILWSWRNMVTLTVSMSPNMNIDVKFIVFKCQVVKLGISVPG